MNLDDQTAHSLACRLASIQGAPRTNIFITAMAEILLSWGSRRGCSLEEAERMVEEAVEDWDKWRGPKGLLLILQSLRPEQSKAVVQSLTCAKCGESGTVQVNGRYEWCVCLCAKTIRAAEPHRVDEMNRPPTEAELAPMTPHEIRLLARGKAMQPRRRQQVAPITRDLTPEQREAVFEDRQHQIQAEIEHARQVLADSDSTPNRREIAWFVLNTYGAAARRKA